MREKYIDQASRFLEPGAFVELLERTRGAMTREEIYRKAGNQPFKDGWQAAMFALGYQEYRRVPTEVRICAPAQFPDFQVRIESNTFDFEATMVLLKGKRLGDEFKGDKDLGPVRKTAPETLPVFDLEDLRAAITKKTANSYSGKPSLLVYLNTQGKNVQLTDLATVAGHNAAFESIWFLTDHYIGCGKTSPLLPAPEGWFRIPIE